MCLKSESLQSILRLWPDRDTGDMLPQRCPNCDWSEEGAAGALLRFQMRLQRLARIISVSLVLLLGMTMATLVLLLFGSPIPLHRNEPDPLKPFASEAVREKLQSDPSHPSALLTIKEKSQTVWQCDIGNAYRRGNMIFDGGNLSVPTDGLYRLYLQITFEFVSKSNSNLCASDLLTLQIGVKRLSKSYPGFRPLLESQDTMSCDQDWSRSMFTSGTFELEAQSQLMVYVTHSKLINEHDTLSFFGVELISTD